MKRFQFALEKVLTYRKNQVELEKARLVAKEVELSRLREELASLNASFQREVSLVLPNPQSRTELGRYRMVIETQTIRLNQKIQAAQNEVALQKAIYVKANQAAEVLIKVRSKQFKSWEQDMQKELDSLAMDSYLAKWKN